MDAVQQRRAQQRRQALEDENSYRVGRPSPTEQTASAIDGIQEQIQEQGMQGIVAAGAETEKQSKKKGLRSAAVNLATNAALNYVRPYRNIIFALVIIGVFVFVVIFKRINEIHDSTGISIQGICETLGSENCIQQIIDKGGAALESNAN